MPEVISANGKADAVTIISPSTALSDAAATAVANIVKDKEDIDTGVKLARGIPSVQGCVIIKDTSIGTWGDLKLFKI